MVWCWLLLPETTATMLSMSWETALVWHSFSKCRKNRGRSKGKKRQGDVSVFCSFTLIHTLSLAYFIVVTCPEKPFCFTPSVTMLCSAWLECTAATLRAKPWMRSKSTSTTRTLMMRPSTPCQKRDHPNTMMQKTPWRSLVFRAVFCVPHQMNICHSPTVWWKYVR